jgi:DNA replication protein DnaC
MKGVFRRYRGQTLDDYQPTHETQHDAKEIVRVYIEDLELHRVAGQGITFMGPIGVGKTTLASVVISAAREKGYRVESIEMSAYVQLIKDSWRLDNLTREDYEEYCEQADEVHDRLRYIQGQGRSPKQGADWLLLDDVGREYASESGWSGQQLFDLVRFRYNRRLPTLVTCNLRLSELDNRYTEGLTSVLTECSFMVGIVGDDYRDQIAMNNKIEQWKKDS